MSLDSYLEGLTKEAEQKKVEQVYLKTASTAELMKLVGLGESPEPLDKTAAPKKEPSTAAQIASIAALPVAGAAIGGAIGGPAMWARHGKFLPGLKGGAGIGGATGAAVAGLIGLSKLIEKADPSGKMIETAVQLAPAVGAVAGMATQEGAFMRAHGREKTSALKVGDAAGRILAKMAQTGAPAPVQLKGSELQEAAQEAQEREDIPGRARRWGRVGGALGAGAGVGLGGGIGHFLSKALGAKSGLPGALAGAAGLGLGGGFLGARIGRTEGAEEAAADRIISQLRARQNLQRGAAMGYMAAQQQMGGSPFPVGR